MKHILRLMVIAGFATMVACGPSAEEKAAEQARLDSLKADSIAKVEAARLDSIKAVEMQAMQDSMEKAKADSIAAAEAAKTTKKGK